MTGKLWPAKPKAMALRCFLKIAHPRPNKETFLLKTMRLTRIITL